MLAVATYLVLHAVTTWLGDYPSRDEVRVALAAL
jgi:hypothetical protein